MYCFKTHLTKVDGVVQTMIIKIMEMMANDGFGITVREI